MEGALIAVALVAVLISRPIELRLWRAGRLSDRTAALLLLGRFPFICGLFGLILGAPLLLVIEITTVAVLPTALFHEFMLAILRDQAREDRRPA